MVFLLEYILIESISVEYLLDSALSKQDLVLLDKIGHLFILFGWLVSHIFWVVLRICLKGRLQLTIH